MRRAWLGQGRIGLEDRGRWLFPKTPSSPTKAQGLPVKGVAMKKFVVVLGAVIAASSLSVSSADASWNSLSYGGYQPWWNIFAHRNRNLSCEEERLQRFWHDYYDALSQYYSALDRIDWVAYYKNHGYQINAACNGGPGGCCQRIQFAPVMVNPQMQWAVPNGCLQGPPACPPGMGMGMGCGMPPMMGH
jgi:hypothetical protein